ncbi:MAG: helix-turn-helix domain-containing protein [Merismopedia sp. SIO2A8]|nr:helix-turn-helix domain-containing protein [Symploca sp. SIO2B6]NET47294.1 helix-turn-helix domain-containing protein [Merismopedia sp. SIO2A8]
MKMMKWKLAELMARHRVTGRDLAKKIGKHENSITRLKGETSMPKISGEDLETLLLGIEELAEESTKNRPLQLSDLLEWERG